MENGGVVLHINLGARWEWSASRPGGFTPGELGWHV